MNVCSFHIFHLIAILPVCAFQQLKISISLAIYQINDDSFISLSPNAFPLPAASEMSLENANQPSSPNSNCCVVFNPKADSIPTASLVLYKIVSKAIKLDDSHEDHLTCEWSLKPFRSVGIKGRIPPIMGDFQVAAFLAKRFLPSAWQDAFCQQVESLLKAKDSSSIFSALNDHLEKNTFFSGFCEASLSDVYLWSFLHQNPNVLASISSKFPQIARHFDFMRSLDVVQEALAFFRENSPAEECEIEDQASFEIDLPGAVDGNVVTRFPPEPSGYLHIGHAKAAVLNEYFARKFHGKLIVRFDDTNPSKENSEFESSILEDLKTIGIVGDFHSHTSDYFDQIYQYALQMILQGKAYCDNTPAEQMSQERLEGKESKCRNNSVEVNLKHFKEMEKGSPEGLTFCLRAKIGMHFPNGALRDPVIYRCNLIPHHRTGTKYKIYPTYDLACPIVDSIEGVTHALRTNEYADREDLYYWIIDAIGLRKPVIYDYGRLNFVYTLLSKRKLNWFVANGKVSGWDDPRFPTIRGILRRGLTVEALRKYMMMQGPSKNTVLLEWDKIWSVNKKIIDLQAPRFTALFANSLCSVEVLGEEASNYSLPQTKSILKHKKNEKLGSKTMVFYKQLLFEQADAKEMQVGEEITLMDWGNAFVRSVERDEDTGIVSEITIELNLKGDVKKTKKKVTWISNVETNIVPLVIHDYDYLITKKKLGEGEKFEDCLNPVTEIVHQAIGDGNFSSVRPGDIFQIERKDFFICDSVAADAVHIIPIPDGKKKK